MRGEALIYKRRAQEEKLSMLNTKLKTETAMKHKAVWEGKTDGIITRSAIKEKMIAARQQMNQQLQMRRNKLAMLLEEEERQFQAELLERVETPGMVREKMAAKLENYKRMREEERRANVVELQKRRFKDQTDQVRLEDSKLFQQKCVYDQEQQMREKLQQRERETMEEFLYAELWKRDMEQKIARERIEAENNKKAVEERQAVLDWQKQKLKEQREDQARLRAAEARMLQENLKIEDENEKAKEQAKMHLMQARAREIQCYNEKIIQLRKDEEQREKEIDKVLLNNILKREQEIKIAEEAQRQKIRDEASKIQQMFDNKAELLKREERELEEYVMQQNEARKREQDKKWEEEAENKRKLMMDVYADRAKALDHHKWLKNEELRKAEQEKNALDQEIARQNSLYEAMRAEKQSVGNLKRNQEDILRQIGEKERKKRDEFREYMYEERAKKLGELTYQRRVKEEKDLARIRLESLKQNNTFMV